MAHPEGQRSLSITPLYVQVRGWGKYGSVAALLYATLLAMCWVLSVVYRNSLGFSAVVYATTSSVVALLVLRRWRFERVTVAVEEDALVLRRRSRSLRLRLPAVREGWLESPGYPIAACLRTVSGETLVFWFKDEPTAQQLLITAGVDEKQKAVEWRLAQRRSFGYAVSLAAPALVLVSALWSFSSHPEFTRFAMIFLAFLVAPLARWTWLLLRFSRVQIGIDGLVLRAALRRRFIGYREIEDVSQTPSGDTVVLRLVRGRRLMLSPAYLDDSNKVATSTTRARQFCSLVRAHLASQTKTSEVDALRVALERRSASLGEWRQRLQQLVRGGYRAHAVHSDDLGSVLDDASATPEQRIGAALALADSRGADYRERLRVAADRCAEPKLRVAIERVASGELTDQTDFDALLEALGVARSAVVRVEGKGQ